MYSCSARSWQLPERTATLITALWRVGVCDVGLYIHAQRIRDCAVGTWPMSNCSMTVSVSEPWLHGAWCMDDGG